MRLLDTLRRPSADRDITFDDYFHLLNETFGFGGLDYPLLNQTFVGGKQAQISPTYSGLASGAFKANGIVFACVLARMQLFSEAKFQFRPKGSYANGDLFGKPSLGLLEKPWPQGTTRDLLTMMDLDAQLAGTAYIYREDDSTLRRANPEWVTVVLGTRREDGQVGDLDTEVAGYIYRPNGTDDIESVKVLLPGQMAKFAPIPDPVFPFRGMSWIRPVIEEIMGDSAATTHKLKFFENSATPNMVFTIDGMASKEEFEKWVEAFKDAHHGTLNAYKNLYLTSAVDAKVVGADMKQLDFKVTQAHGEVRVCNAARIPAIIVGVSEGLDSATYSNYALAKRAWADGSVRSLWGQACEVLEALVEVPSDSELWYDERQIAFLREDQKDLVVVQQGQAAALKSLIDGGFTPDSAVEAIMSGDLSKLLHTGLYSVQLQPPGTVFEPTKRGLKQISPPDGPSNGNGQAHALSCGHCGEEAGQNRACLKCIRFSRDLNDDRECTVAALAEQLGITTAEVERALNAKVEREALRAQIAARSVKSYL